MIRCKLYTYYFIRVSPIPIWGCWDENSLTDIYWTEILKAYISPFRFSLVNSLTPINITWRHWTWSTLNQIIALSRRHQAITRTNIVNQTLRDTFQWIFVQNTYLFLFFYFHSSKCISKCRLLNGSRFLQDSCVTLIGSCQQCIG